MCKHVLPSFAFSFFRPNDPSWKKRMRAEKRKWSETLINFHQFGRFCQTRDEWSVRNEWMNVYTASASFDPMVDDGDTRWTESAEIDGQSDDDRAKQDEPTTVSDEANQTESDVHVVNQPEANKKRIDHPKMIKTTTKQWEWWWWWWWAQASWLSSWLCVGWIVCKEI